MQFETTKHHLVLSQDGSYTAYSKEYGEHYHSTKDGALNESLFKHVVPAMRSIKSKDEVVILDICFGLGFNTLATLLYAKEHLPHAKIKIFTPELDMALLDSLPLFSYPQELLEFRGVIEALVEQGFYENAFWHVELYRGDAREYVRSFPHATFDIVYQDAFSLKKNPLLWTLEYFQAVARILKPSGILTTYSTAAQARLALYESGFILYINRGEGYRDATIASKEKLCDFWHVDMEHKKRCNPTLHPLRDAEVLKSSPHMPQIF